MHNALIEQLNMFDIDTLSFAERLGLLTDRELTEREDRHLRTRLRRAKLKHNAISTTVHHAGWIVRAVRKPLLFAAV